MLRKEPGLIKEHAAYSIKCLFLHIPPCDAHGLQQTRKAEGKHMSPCTGDEQKAILCEPQPMKPVTFRISCLSLARLLMGRNGQVP